MLPGDYAFSLVDPFEPIVEVGSEPERVFSVWNDPERIVYDTFTVQVGNPEVIPLPATGLLLIGGLGTLVMVRRREG